MSTLTALDAIQVSQAMSQVKLTVSPVEKVDPVAKKFQQHHVNSAPVVDEFGRCIGVITSTDLVRFQSQLPEISGRIDRGLAFDVSRRTPDGSVELVPHPFDEIQRQMTSSVQTIDQSKTLRLAIRIMCRQHIHHLIVLDESQRPVGILSSLDILTKLNEC